MIPRCCNPATISAEAMAYRDARRQAMAAQDWAAIESQLLQAYRLLKAAVAGG
jgi:hypothetical protein